METQFSHPFNNTFYAMNTLTHTYPGPSFYNTNFKTTNSLDIKTDDELFVESWLSKIGKNNLISDTSANRKAEQSNVLKICEVKQNLSENLYILDKLKSMESLLQQNVTTMTVDEWNEKLKEIESLKQKLSQSLAFYENPSIINSIKVSLKKRSKKRLQQQRKRIELQKLKQEEKRERERKHKESDEWLENMKESVERAKAEENMKKEADVVLSEVTKKKSDAKKQLNLIAALVKLRYVRETVAIQAGKQLLEEDKSAFSKTTDRLTTIWENSFRTYCKEEQGLKIMLEQNATEESKQTVLNKEKRIANQWENILFSPNYVQTTPTYWNLTVAERDVEAFVTIRKLWDSYLSSDATGSKIPVGWVLPNENPSDKWTEYLQK